MYLTIRVYKTYRWGFDDGHSLYHFLLVHFRARTIEVANYRGHASFVSHCSSKVHGLLGIIFGKALAVGMSASAPGFLSIDVLTLFPGDGLLVSEGGKRAIHVVEPQIFDETSCLLSSH